MEVYDDLQNMENIEREVLSREDAYHVDRPTSDQFKENLPKVDLPTDDLTEDLLREDLSKELTKEDQERELQKEEVITENIPEEDLVKEDLLREDLAKELPKEDLANEQPNKALPTQDLSNEYLEREDLLREELAKDLSQKDQVGELPMEDLAKENLSNEYLETENYLREDLGKEIPKELQPRELSKEDLTKEGLANEHLETDNLEPTKDDLVEEKLSKYNLSQNGLLKEDIPEQQIHVQSTDMSQEDVLKVDETKQYQTTKDILEEEQTTEKIKTDILLSEAPQKDHTPNEDVSTAELLNEGTVAKLLPQKDRQTDESLIESLLDKPSSLSLYVGNLNSRFSKEVLTCMLKDILASISVNLQRHDIEIIKKGRNAYAFVHLESESSYQIVMTQFQNPSNLEQSLLKELVKKGKTLKVSEAKSNLSITETSFPKRKSVKKSKMEEESQKVSGSGASFPVGEWTDPMSGFVAGTKSESAIVRQHIVGKERFFYGALLGSENRNVEFKRGGGEYLTMTFKHHIRKYTCAFLNSEGGSLFVGVEDSGAVLGVQCNHKEEDRLRLLVDSILKGFKPPLFPAAYSLTFIPVIKPGDTGLFQKVIRLTVHRPREQNEPLLYETDQGEVYLRRDGSVQGPLSGNAIQEWCRQVRNVKLLPLSFVCHPGISKERQHTHQGYCITQLEFCTAVQKHLKNDYYDLTEKIVQEQETQSYTKTP
ncbi:hypothetical protein NDU88_006465 [Pleurodeles waltl]|uniref:RRM domain-containing protein n=1 Tax=Pleurodeles waltl TaxID=8319 RepID=A0AAV7UL38_PLEWA|nr:hypothetical protein NDU88_006465 [Pleurodeles waltl]